MTFSTATDLSASYLTGGVLPMRLLAWLVDMALIAVLVWLLWWALVVFGFLTFGLGLRAMVILPAVPFLYYLLSLLGRRSATPGQQVFGLTVRDNDDLGPPTPLQALVNVALFHLTLATSGLLFLVALFTLRHRTLHDIVSGLVVVRVDALEALTGPRGI